jgi:hypothetical protein
VTVIAHLAPLPFVGLLQAIAQVSSSGGKGTQALAQVLAQSFSSGGTASAAASAVAEAYGKNKGGVSQALAQALVQANSDGGKSKVAAQAVAEVRLGLWKHGHSHCGLRLAVRLFLLPCTRMHMTSLGHTAWHCVCPRNQLQPCACAPACSNMACRLLI